MEYLSILQSLIDEDREEPIEYTDIQYALRDTSFDKNKYYTFHNSLIVCLNELYSYCNEDEFKQFILKNKKYLVDYSQAELNRILTTLDRTFERYNKGFAFQNEDLLNQEINANITSIRDILMTSSKIFNMYDIEWINIRQFTLDIDVIVKSSINSSQYDTLYKAFNELIQLL
jgi:hypothetical protein